MSIPQIMDLFDFGYFYYKPQFKKIMGYEF